MIDIHLSELPSGIKKLLSIFLIVLTVGFISGLDFVHFNTGGKPSGVTEHYLGNESDEEAVVMKFKKSEKSILNTIHSHMISMAMIFLILGLLLYLARLNYLLKMILIIEPFLSVLITFGGLYFLWKGIEWMSYVVMISGILMTLSYFISVLIIFAQILRKRTAG
ncbi:MAG: hypothetical protein HKO67_12090 [Flavobacteriaceae bacterium]|nr:hypothetical protein [Bacteroidia bacterium]NNL81220.1 hypothetical protein [Flavobacteriaceae bacterium]